MTAHRLLSSADEARLSRRIKCGDRAARDEMIACNLGLVRSLAWRCRGHGVPFEDLVQEGTVGLVHAVERFDHQRGLKFSTYAVWWIRRSLSEALGGARPIRIPPGAQRRLAAILRAQEELRRLGVRSPSDEAIAERTGLPVHAVRALRSAPRVSASLDEPVGEDATPFADLIADDDAVDACQATLDGDARRRLWALLRLLPCRHREVVLRSYGLRDGCPQTHAEIGLWLGVGEERSRQLQRQALHWLRELAGPSALPI